VLEEITPEEAAQAMLNPAVRIIGPFRGGIYYLAVNNCKVPCVHLYKRRDTGYEWALVVDDRWEVDASEEEIMRWGYVLAQAMAVGAGYTYHGPDSRPLNRHAVQIGPL
jgi:hypothetical protein